MNKESITSARPIFHPSPHGETAAWETWVCTQVSLQRIHTKQGHSHELSVQSLVHFMVRVNFPGILLPWNFCLKIQANWNKNVLTFFWIILFLLNYIIISSELHYKPAAEKVTLCHHVGFLWTALSLSDAWLLVNLTPVSKEGYK